MFRPQHSTPLLVVVALLTPCAVVAADPPKTDRYVAPLSTLIEMLQEDDRAEQHTAAKRIRDFYPGDKCLEALPHLVAAMGKELGRRHDTPGTGLGLPQMIGEAVQTAGSKRFKALFELTTHKDPLVRAGAFALLYFASDVNQKSFGPLKEKSELDLTELLTAVKKGVKDESPLVRKQALIATLAMKEAEEKLKASVVEVLTASLDDREEIKGKHLDIPATYAAVALSQFGEAAKPAFDSLIKTVTTEDVRCGDTCCAALARVAKLDPKLTERAVAVFREQLTKSKPTSSIRASAVRGLGVLDRGAKPAIRDLAAVLEEEDLKPAFRDTVYQTLKDLGPTSAAAVPALITRLDKAVDQKEQMWVLVVFAAIGPAAGDAVKPLEECAKKVPESEKRMQQAVLAALASIK